MKLLHRLALFLTLLLSVGTVSAAARSVLMVIPEPIAVPAGVSEDNAGKALKAALVGRTWTISGERPGEVDATLNLRQHVLKMKFGYSGGKITMSYVDSSVLGYEVREHNEAYIHPNVMKWWGLLVMDINANLLRV